MKQAFVKALFTGLIIFSFYSVVFSQDLNSKNKRDYKDIAVSFSLKEVFGDLKTPLENPDEILKIIKSTIEKEYSIKFHKHARFDVGACMQDVLMSYEHISKLSLGCTISEFDIDFNSQTRRAGNFSKKTIRIFEYPILKAVIKYNCDNTAMEFTCEGHQY